MFERWPAFFDAEDHLQVRYEMLRAHLVDRDATSAIGQRFGVSRQTFYNLQAKFAAAGTGGLLAQRPGPKGPRKVTAEVATFVHARLDGEEAFSTPGVLAEIHARFGVVMHRRTLEKLVRDLRAKKITLAPDAHTAGSHRGTADRAAAQYERLRDRWAWMSSPVPAVAGNSGLSRSSKTPL